MTDTIEARVARGAAWLDSHKPGWEGIVSLNDLKMQLVCSCVLGQVFEAEAEEMNLAYSGFSFALDHLDQDDISEEGPDIWAMDHGFDCNADGAEDFKLLHDAWVSLLKTRSDTGTLSGV